MKTTLDIPDDLFRQIKIKAATDGRKLKDMVTEGLELVLAGTASSGRSPTGAKAGAAKSLVREKKPPAWFGALASYARRAGVRSDMDSIRASIARGIAKERQL